MNNKLTFWAQFNGRRILNALGITLLIFIAGLIYFKNEASPQALNFTYTRTFHTGYTIKRDQVAGVILGHCNHILSHFKLDEDSAYLDFFGRPLLRYKVLGVDSSGGLHLLGTDSAQVTVYKRFDPRYKADQDSSGLQFIFSRAFAHGEIILFPTKQCF